ncbi:MAG: DUF4442 domain-containing protein [Acidobacteriota bacterium]
MTPNPPAPPRALQGTAAQRQRQLTNPWQLRLFMLTKLPLALIAGLRVHRLDAQTSVTSVPYRWLTTNPFRSTYFAAQAMAAELATGILPTLAVEAAKPDRVAMLIVGMEAQFVKKATGRTFFTCDMGDAFFAAVERACTTGEAQTVAAETIGRDADGNEISRFTFTWSFKKRTR